MDGFRGEGGLGKWEKRISLLKKKCIMLRTVPQSQRTGVQEMNLACWTGVVHLSSGCLLDHFPCPGRWRSSMSHLKKERKKKKPTSPSFSPSPHHYHVLSHGCECGLCFKSPLHVEDQVLSPSSLWISPGTFSSAKVNGSLACVTWLGCLKAAVTIQVGYQGDRWRQVRIPPWGGGRAAHT